MIGQAAAAAEGAPPVLAPQEAACLAALARTCRAALHAVSLYPPEHPAISSALERLEGAGRQATGSGPFTVSVLPAELRVRGRVLPRPDTAAQEFASLLHAHLVAALTVKPGIGASDWRQFVSLVASPAEDVREQGGIARAWTTGGGQHLEITEIDYSRVLEARDAGDVAEWSAIVDRCLAGDLEDLDERARRALLEILGDQVSLTDFLERLEGRRGRGGGRASIVLQLLAATAALLDQAENGDKAGQVLTNVASVGALPGEVIEKSSGSGAALARYLAGAITAGAAPSGRLAQAFRTLVPDRDRRLQVLEMARAGASSAPAANPAGLDDIWNRFQAIVTTYDDSRYVSEEYRVELDKAGSADDTAEMIADDPPEVLATWLSTVSDRSIRRLDVALLLDLLAVEQDSARWTQIVEVVGTELDDLLLVGDFEQAARLLGGLLETAPGSRAPAFREAGAGLIGRMIKGGALVHVAYHLRTASESEFAAVEKLCLMLGAPVVKPLAEMVAVERHGRVRHRLTQILIGFGSLGRQSVEQLKQSLNASVRRTAVYLLREFGGSDALPDLEALLNDTEPRVQREAVRAIVNIGTDEAYAVLQRALTSGNDSTRTAIFNHLRSGADQRLVPLFRYILDHAKLRSSLEPVAARAIRVLSEIGGDEAIDALEACLHSGLWWAPLRTASLRRTAATALGRIGTGPALDALRHAADHGRRGVRAAARAALAGPDTCEKAGNR